MAEQNTEKVTREPLLVSSMRRALGDPIGPRNVRLVGGSGTTIKGFLAEFEECIAAVKAEALHDAADEIQRVRVNGLDPGMDWHPTSDTFEFWLRERAQRFSSEASQS